MIEWDETKRLENVEKHGLDFDGADAVFDHPVLTNEDTRTDYGEVRMNLLGWLDGAVVHMTYVERKEGIRIVSLRRATRNETRTYFQNLSR